MGTKGTARLKLKLTEGLVAALEHEGEGDRTRVYDTVQRGLHLVIHASGRKTWCVAYGLPDGRERRMTLGPAGERETSLKDARARATEVLAKAQAGEDPLEEKRRIRDTATFAEFWEQYLDDAKGRWKPRTLEANTDLWNRLVRPALGHKPLSGIKAGDVAAFHRKHRETPVQANIALRLVKAMLNRAVEWELIPAPSPASRVKQFPERRRERFLSPEEFHVLWAAIAQEEAEGGKKSASRPDDPEALAEIEKRLLAEGRPVKRRKDGSLDRRHLAEAATRGITPHAAGLFRLLALTGARLTEIMHARWDWVRWQERVLALPDSKTGAKRLPLSQAALDELTRLQEIRTVGCPWVIEGARPTAHLVNPQKPWDRVKATAGLLLNRRRLEAGLEPTEGNPFADLRLHDLRHSFASVGVGAGLSLAIVGKTLGHAQGRTTERYAHLAADPVLAAADLVGAKILEAVNGPMAVVEELKRKEQT